MYIEFLKRQKHLLIMPAYMIIYMAIFAWVEDNNVRYHIIYSPLDDLIPFCEYFIVPYVLWFPFVAASVFWIGIKKDGRDEHNRLAAILCTGMTVFLLISLIFPNGQNLRPEISELTSGGFFLEAVKILYIVDTSTNVLPSIHVFNSLACCGALMRDETIRSNKARTLGVLLLTGTIVASTMFLKQHSVIDVAAAFVLYGVCYALYYAGCFNTAFCNGAKLKKKTARRKKVFS